MPTVDLNSDLGEGFGTYRCGDDDAMLSIVTSANVACGLHAGDAERIVVVAVDAPRRAAHAIAHACGWPVPRDGAVALLVSSAPIGREITEAETATAGAPNDMPHAPGHEALLPLVSGATVAACASPWRAFARVVLASDLATPPAPPSGPCSSRQN